MKTSLLKCSSDYSDLLVQYASSLCNYLDASSAIV